MERWIGWAARGGRALLVAIHSVSLLACPGACCTSQPESSKDSDRAGDLGQLERRAGASGDLASGQPQASGASHTPSIAVDNVDASREETDARTDEDGASMETQDASLKAEKRCPKDMVNVGGRYCIDRYEDTLVDDSTGAVLSPHYPPEPGVPQRIYNKWTTERWTLGPVRARAKRLPILPEFELTTEFRPRAASRRGVLPQGYTSGKMANAACTRAGKRLCTLEEWRRACRGQKGTKYPYGEEYEQGSCNVYRSQHPAALLHDNASIGHSDPRLGLVRAEDGPLLHPTGTTPKCASRWGKDAIYDMVGNLDEWIDDPDGTFVGGFFSRATREGCDSIITVHPYQYWDYSLGIRCCRSLEE